MAEHKTCCTPRRQNIGAYVKGFEKESASAKYPPSLGSDTEHNIIAIPGGIGYVGTDKPIFALDEEAPYRGRPIKPFWIDECAVTNARFAEFVEATGYKTEAEQLDSSFVFYGLLTDQTDVGNAVAAAPWWRMTAGACWYHPAGPDSDVSAFPDYPVVHISWHDAMAFAQWAGGRLPTEAEWEHAARGGLGDACYPWGDKAPDDNQFLPCNIWQGQFPENNSNADGYYGTAPVRSFEANGYGLFNMVGNVWEWTAQSFKVRSLKKAIRQVHHDRRGFKVCKGGSYLCHASYCHRYRIAARTANSPDSSTGHTGFRLVYDKI